MFPFYKWWAGIRPGRKPNARSCQAQSWPEVAETGLTQFAALPAANNRAALAVENKIHPMNNFSKSIAPFTCAAAILLACGTALVNAAEIPKVGDQAPDFSLKTLDDQTVRLNELTTKGNVVLVVLRGWPGYQCPICDRQVQDFIKSKAEFAEAKAQLVFVYPGPAEDLKAHAEEFKKWKNKEWPGEYLYVLDPDYTMVNAYALRWNAPRETAYPSTFVLDNKGIVHFAKVSHTHGDRTKAADVLTEAKKLAGNE
jgi:thioredoxin-dependent peroxiredoxin